MSSAQRSMYALILAGGKGTRLWPLSTNENPKQLLALEGNSSLLERTVARILPVVPLPRVCIATGTTLELQIRKHLPNIHPENVIIEPVGRNTLPCIGLAALYLRRRQGGDSVMIVLPSDHIIKNQKRFHSLAQYAANIATNHRALITFGIPPTRAETGYGYIHFGEACYAQGGSQAFRMLEFVEKPDRETAQRYLESGTYLWNSGMFVWRVDTILDAVKTHQPAIYRKLMAIDTAIGTTQETETIDHVYPQITSLSIDYGVMEKADNVVVIPADIGWDDVGSWTAMRALLDQDASRNAVHGKHVGLETQDCIIYGQDRLIATLGVSNLVIVECDQAVLVCPVERAQEVRKLVEELERGTA